MIELYGMGSPNVAKVYIALEEMALPYRVHPVDVFVSPDESYLIHVSSGRPDGLGESDLYISFREPDGSWGSGVHLGDGINSPRADYCPVVSPDGKIFFFTQGDDLMWVDAAVLERYRPAG